MSTIFRGSPPTLGSITGGALEISSGDLIVNGSALISGAGLIVEGITELQGAIKAVNLPGADGADGFLFEEPTTHVVTVSV